MMNPSSSAEKTGLAGHPRAGAMAGADHPSHTPEEATPKDVKNEGRSGDVYENKGTSDTMSDMEMGILAEIARILQKRMAYLSLSATLFCNLHVGDESQHSRRGKPQSSSKGGDQDDRLGEGCERFFRTKSEYDSGTMSAPEMAKSFWNFTAWARTLRMSPVRVMASTSRKVPRPRTRSR